MKLEEGKIVITMPCSSAVGLLSDQANHRHYRQASNDHPPQYSVHKGLYVIRCPVLAVTNGQI